MTGTRFLFIFFSTIISIESRSQFFTSPDENKIHITFTGGYVQSEIKGSFVDYQLGHYFGNKPELYGRDGIEIEALMNLRINRFLYAKTGIGYNEQGGEVRHNDLVYPVDITLRYVHLPISIGAYLLTLNRLTLAAEGGFQLNQEISSNQDFKKGTLNKNWSATFIPAYTYRVLIQYQINQKMSIQGSYKYVDSLKPFYEEEYFTSSIEMSTEAKSYSVGVWFSVN